MKLNFGRFLLWGSISAPDIRSVIASMKLTFVSLFSFKFRFHTTSHHKTRYNMTPFISFFNLHHLELPFLTDSAPARNKMPRRLQFRFRVKYPEAALALVRAPHHFFARVLTPHHFFACVFLLYNEIGSWRQRFCFAFFVVILRVWRTRYSIDSCWKPLFPPCVLKLLHDMAWQQSFTGTPSTVLLFQAAGYKQSNYRAYHLTGPYTNYIARKTYRFGISSHILSNV